MGFSRDDRSRVLCAVACDFLLVLERKKLQGGCEVTRTQRKLHLFIWLVLFVAISVVVIVAINARPAPLAAGQQLEDVNEAESRPASGDAR